MVGAAKWAGGYADDAGWEELKTKKKIDGRKRRSKHETRDAEESVGEDPGVLPLRQKTNCI